MEKLEEIKSMLASVANEIGRVREMAERASEAARIAEANVEDVLRQACLLDAHLSADVLMEKFADTQKENPPK
jgi:hypothetical protein